MSATLKKSDKEKEEKEVKGEKISFTENDDYMAIQLNGPDGKPTGETFIEHKVLAEKLIAKKAATEVKGAKIEVAESPTQILKS